MRILLPVLVIPLAACHLMPANKHLPGSGATPTAESVATAPASATAADGSDGPGDDLPAQPEVTPAQLEAHLVKLFEADARWSAAQVQGKPSLCPVAAGAQALAVWATADNSRGERSFYCFAGTPGTNGSLVGLRSAQNPRHVFDGQLAHEVLKDVPTKESFAVGVGSSDGGRTAFFWGVELGATVGLVVIPYDKPANGANGRGALFPQFDALAHPDQAMVDVLAMDRAAAASVDLAAEKTRLVAKTIEVVKATNDVWQKEEAELVAKVLFPKPAGKDAKVVAVVKAYLNDHAAETDIDPKAIKKIIVTSAGWEVRTNDVGIPTGKVQQATIGFARKDGTCAFMSMQVQKDYTGGGSYNDLIYVNGFQSGWESILCENIK